MSHRTLISHIRRASAALVALLAVMGVGSSIALGQLSYVDRSAGLGVPELDTGKMEIEFGDVDGDGHLDLVTIGDHGSPHGSDEHGVTVWFGDGAGHWSIFQYGNFGYGGVALGDVNHDGFLDVGYGMHHNYSGVDLGDQLLEVALGDGTGQLWTPWDDGLATHGEDWGMFGADFADVDNDGDLDLGATSFGGSNGARVYANNLDGSWTQTSAQACGNSTMLFAFGDFNGDGLADFASAGGSATVAFGDGSGNFTATMAGSRSGISMGDVNDNGRDDLAYVSNGGIKVSTYTDDGTWQDISGNLPASGGFVLTRIADMNVDGFGDIVAFAPGSDTPGTIAIYLGDGAGDWQLATTITTPDCHGFSTLQAGMDLDHNGYPDLLVVQEEDYFIPPFIWVDKNQLYCYAEASTPDTTWIHPLYPRGGETIIAGSVRFIDWTAAIPGGGPSAMAIELSIDGPDGPWMPIVASTPNNGRYQWLVPAGLPTSETCHLRYALDAVHAITPQPFTIVGAYRRGDHDDDGDVDLADFAALPACLTGPDGGPLPAGCVVFDFDLDEDCDFVDIAAYQRAFTGG
jgi:hypothetical protein